MVGVGARYPGRFEDLVNEAAARFRVGIRLEGSRFVELTSEHFHETVTRPALLLLSEPGLEEVDGLYRKAYERLLAGDAGGAITAAASAVEQMLRELGSSGGGLQPLARHARAQGRITAGVEQQIVKLDAFRAESDAHSAGTDEPEPARLVVNIAASILLYLGGARANGASSGGE